MKKEYLFLNRISLTSTILTSSSSATIPLRSSSDNGPSSSADEEFSFQLVSKVGKVCVKFYVRARRVVKGGTQINLKIISQKSFDNLHFLFHFCLLELNDFTYKWALEESPWWWTPGPPCRRAWTSPSAPSAWSPCQGPPPERLRTAGRTLQTQSHLV